MREIVLDTETTGLDPEAGDRIVEIGAVELFNHLPTERRFHRYLNPERSMPPEAFAVHGLSDEFLSDKPRFSEVVDEFLHFVGEDARLVIHNAAFDMRFLNAELTRCGRRALPDARALDTLMLARQRFPGAQNSLDALCRRFGVDNTRRTLHGALLDSEILAEVYLELIGGRQPDLVLDRPSEAADVQMRAGMAQHRPLTRPAPLPPRLSAAERGAHDAFVTQMGDKAIWRRYLATAGAGG